MDTIEKNKNSECETKNFYNNDNKSKIEIKFYCINEDKKEVELDSFHNRENKNESEINNSDMNENKNEIDLNNFHNNEIKNHIEIEKEEKKNGLNENKSNYESEEENLNDVDANLSDEGEEVEEENIIEKDLILQRYKHGINIDLNFDIVKKCKVIDFYSECLNKYKNENSFVYYQNYNSNNKVKVDELMDVEQINNVSVTNENLDNINNLSSLNDKSLLMKNKNVPKNTNMISNSEEFRNFNLQKKKQESLDPLLKCINSLSDRINLQHLVGDPTTYFKIGGGDMFYDINDPFLDDEEMYKELNKTKNEIILTRQIEDEYSIWSADISDDFIEINPDYFFSFYNSKCKYDFSIDEKDEKKKNLKKKKNVNGSEHENNYNDENLSDISTHSSCISSNESVIELKESATDFDYEKNSNDIIIYSSDDDLDISSDDDENESKEEISETSEEDIIFNPFAWKNFQKHIPAEFIHAFEKLEKELDALPTEVNTSDIQNIIKKSIFDIFLQVIEKYANTLKHFDKELNDLIEIDVKLLRWLTTIMTKMSNCLSDIDIYRIWFENVFFYNTKVFITYEKEFIKKLKDSQIFEKNNITHLNNILKDISLWKAYQENKEKLSKDNLGNSYNDNTGNNNISKNDDMKRNYNNTQSNNNTNSSTHNNSSNKNNNNCDTNISKLNDENNFNYLMQINNNNSNDSNENYKKDDNNFNIYKTFSCNNGINDSDISITNDLKNTFNKVNLENIYNNNNANDNNNNNNKSSFNDDSNYNSNNNHNYNGSNCISDNLKKESIEENEKSRFLNIKNEMYCNNNISLPLSNKNAIPHIDTDKVISDNSTNLNSAFIKNEDSNKNSNVGNTIYFDINKKSGDIVNHNINEEELKYKDKCSNENKINDIDQNKCTNKNNENARSEEEQNTLYKTGMDNQKTEDNTSLEKYFKKFSDISYDMLNYIKIFIKQKCLLKDMISAGFEALVESQNKHFMKMPYMTLSEILTNLFNFRYKTNITINADYIEGLLNFYQEKYKVDVSYEKGKNKKVFLFDTNEMNKVNNIYYKTKNKKLFKEKSLTNDNNNNNNNNLREENKIKNCKNEIEEKNNIKKKNNNNNDAQLKKDNNTNNKKHALIKNENKSSNRKKMNDVITSSNDKEFNASMKKKKNADKKKNNKIEKNVCSHIIIYSENETKASSPDKIKQNKNIKKNKNEDNKTYTDIESIKKKKKNKINNKNQNNEKDILIIADEHKNLNSNHILNEKMKMYKKRKLKNDFQSSKKNTNTNILKFNKHNDKIKGKSIDSNEKYREYNCISIETSDDNNY